MCVLYMLYILSLYKMYVHTIYDVCNYMIYVCAFGVLLFSTKKKTQSHKKKPTKNTKHKNQKDKQNHKKQQTKTQTKPHKKKKNTNIATQIGGTNMSDSAFLGLVFWGVVFHVLNNHGSSMQKQWLVTCFRCISWLPGEAAPASQVRWHQQLHLEALHKA